MRDDIVFVLNKFVAYVAKNLGRNVALICVRYCEYYVEMDMFMVERNCGFFFSLDIKYRLISS